MMVLAVSVTEAEEARVRLPIVTVHSDAVLGISKVPGCNIFKYQVCLG